MPSASTRAADASAGRITAPILATNLAIATKVSHNRYVKKLGEFLEEAGGVLEEVVQTVANFATGTEPSTNATADAAQIQPPLVPADSVISEE